MLARDRRPSLSSASTLSASQLSKAATHPHAALTFTSVARSFRSTLLRQSRLSTLSRLRLHRHQQLDNACFRRALLQYRSRVVESSVYTVELLLCAEQTQSESVSRPRQSSTLTTSLISHHLVPIRRGRPTGSFGLRGCYFMPSLPLCAPTFTYLIRA
ncbi:hypothetical protein BCV70DRAFT_75470 [Testicularia cyperi]|uniref:Uncharacterized protein n=1 Tax=Testicularia cyperi TaxID=1882483 RepID=A0A317XTX9_9BASI|nr:hypothetical protein BCV70DRAFT_75470 [Testicularia cyperi]